MTPAVLTYDEAATYLSLKRRTLERLVAEQRIAFVKMGPKLVRFERDALDAFIAAGRRPARFDTAVPKVGRGGTSRRGSGTPSCISDSRPGGTRGSASSRGAA